MLVTTRKFEKLDAAGGQVEVCEISGAGKAVRPIAAPELISRLAADELDDEDQVA